MNIKSTFSFLILGIVVSSCGGGGNTTNNSISLPTANAGNDQTVSSGVTVTLNGVGLDSDGTIDGVQWSEIGSSTLTIRNNTSVSASFDAPTVGVDTNYTLRLLVTDNDGATANDEIIITVTPPAINNQPTVNAGVDQIAFGGTTVRFYGVGIDTDGTIDNYQWSEVGGSLLTLNNDTSANMNIIAPTVISEVSYTLRLMVTDNNGDTATDDVLITLIPPLVKTHPLNDTGVVGCADYAYTDSGTDYDVTGSGIHNEYLICSTQPVVATRTTDGFDGDGDIIRAGQDALYGRDVTHNDNSDGFAGFSFTKLDNNGIALVDQSQDYATNPWACVKDNVTGLIWEVKTTNGLMQHRSHRYTWYNSTGNNDGGDWGIGDTGVGVTTDYETQIGAIAGADLCDNPSRCDTEKYIADINSSNSGAGICGATDWRLPNRQELISIVDYSIIVASADKNYFPNTANGTHWTSLPVAYDKTRSWEINFQGGTISSAGDKAKNNYIRLVRDAP